MLPTSKLAKLADRDDLAQLDPFPRDGFTPVETETGDAMRLEGIRVLTARALELRARGDRQRLTVLEANELRDSQAAIHTLQRMAPTGALQPARDQELDRRF